MYPPIYRARDGKFLGVCQGIARSRDIPVHYLRLGLVLFTVFSGLWLGLAVYIAAALFLNPEPLLTGGTGSTGSTGSGIPRSAGSRTATLALLRDRLHSLTARVQVLEDRVTREDYTWERRLRTPPQ